MDRDWNDRGIAEHWSLGFDEIARIEAKSPVSRLGFAAQLKFCRLTGLFPERAEDIPNEAVIYLADQLERPAEDLSRYDWSARMSQRHRAEIVEFLGIKPLETAEIQALETWLVEECCPSGAELETAIGSIGRWCLARKVRTPSRTASERLVRSAQRRFEDGLLGRIAESLTPDAAARMESSPGEADGVVGFMALKSDPGRIALESILRTADRLAFIRSLDLPRSLLAEAGAPVIERPRRRAAQESGWEMRRHARPRRLGMYAIFLMARESEIVDGLVDLLIETVHKIGVKAERKIKSGIARDIERVYGKERLLAGIAEAALKKPDGKVCDVIFPVAGAKKLQAIVAEFKSRGFWNQRVHQTMRASFSGHYRRMLPAIHELLEFRSNNAMHRPILDALIWLRRARRQGRRVLHIAEGVPIEGVIPAKWRDFVIQKDKTHYTTLLV